MYEDELGDLRGFEGSALREALRTPKLEGIFNSQDNGYVVSVEILNVLVNNILANIDVNASLFKTPIFKAFFELGLNKKNLSLFIETLFDSIEDHLKKSLRFNQELVEVIRKYKTATLSSIEEYGYTNTEYSLAGIEAYKTSKTNNRISVISKNYKKRTIHTLFPHQRYWYPPSDRESGSYNPLQFNQSNTSFSPISQDEEVFPFSYDPSLVYNGRVYLRKPEIIPSDDKFLDTEWDLFNSKRVNLSNTFNNVYSRLVKGIYLGLSESATLVNGITSDSKVRTFTPEFNQVLADKELLINSFGGSGKQIYEKLVDLRLISGYMGGHDGSSFGSVSYISDMAELLDFMTSGKLSDNLRSQGYGAFNKIFFTSSDSVGVSQSINGLRFLERIGSLRSFNQNLPIPSEISIEHDRLSINSLYCKYNSLVPVNTSVKIYESSDSGLDFVNQSLEVLVERCEFLGDKVERISKSLDKYGQLSGYNSLGSIAFQIAELQKSFPPAASFINGLTGFSGSVKKLQHGYSKLSKTLDPFSLPPSLFGNVIQWLKFAQRSLEDLQYELTALGIKTKGSGYLPNIQTKKFVSSSSEIVKYLFSLGFRDSEINQIISIQSFPEFISKFAPISDSSDLASFFKGYELSQLIYEFSGDIGTNAYLDFLYKKSSIEGLLNILYSTEKNKSPQTYLRISKYPRLIALLMSLTYAVDPDQLNKFSYFLGDNNLNLLDSIMVLLKKGQNTILKKKEDIGLLSAVISHSIRGHYSKDLFSSPDLNYEEIEKSSPLALKGWTDLIDKSLGNIDDVRNIKSLYDKSVGLTLKELVTLLNNPSPTSGVGQIIDGFYGGDFTKLIRYANISGLATKLGYYKNSSQLDNVWTDFEKTYIGMPSLLESLQRVIQSLGITIKLLENSVSADLNEYNYEKPGALSEIIKAQNKPTKAMLEVVSNGTVSSTYDPQDPPGIGNSMLPNRVAISNSLTPEQSKILASNVSLLPSRLITEFSANKLISNFIKVTERELIINNISINSNSPNLYGDSFNFGTQKGSPLSTVSTLDNKSIELYKQLKNENISSSGQGKDYITDPDSLYEDSLINRLPKSLFSPYDPAVSCKKFGGSNCDSLYKDSKRCTGTLNKSSFPETYELAPFNNGLVIDRALGYFANYLPSEGDIINNKIPSYYSLLDNPIPGRGTEPILKDSPSSPKVFKGDMTTGDMVEYANTRYALMEFINYSKREYTELTCASLEEAHMYQMCMNILKCKRYKIQNDKIDLGLDFCPQTSAGRKL